MIVFYLILSAVKSDLSQGMFWRLSVGTVALFSSAGESKFMSPMAGFIFGMCSLGFILTEIFLGKIAETGVSVNVRASVTTMQFSVFVGWSIYQIGYLF